jgi:ureidoacrylate peracid hydrolase
MISPVAVDAATAVLLVDLQNDFLAPDGAYGRAGVTSPALTVLPSRVAPVVDAARAAGVPVISAQFTLIGVRGGPPLISAHLAQRRPFLGAGDFAAGGWGHALVDALAPADIEIQKVAYSAFHASALEHVLRALDIRSLIVAGILTNGGVSSTVRDAHVRGYGACVLADGCADLAPELHDAAIRSMSGVARIADCAAATAGLEARRALTRS